MMLTWRQRECYDFIVSHIRTKGWSPTYREIATELGLKSHGHVYNLVRSICNRGYLRQTKHGVDLGKRMEFFRVYYQYPMPNGWPHLLQIWSTSRPARPSEMGSDAQRHLDGLAK